MNVRFLEASELVKEIPKLIATSDELLIAIAYVKKRGLKTLLPELNTFLARNASLKIVFGLSHAYGITDKEAAETLYKISKRSNAEVRKYNNPGFHPKLFIFRGPNPSILIGSSNITGPAQSSNSEANVLIENPDSAFCQDVNTFFDSHFSHAPMLSKNDIKHYNPQQNKIRRASRSKIPLDALPPSTSTKKIAEDIQPLSLWKISPGEDASHWELWVDVIDENGDGFIAIGWDIGDLTNIQTKNELKNRVRIEAESNWNIGREKKVSVGYATNQLWDFKNSVQQGDVVIVYSRRRIFGIAEVIDESPYFYNYTDELYYANQIKVKYLWYHPWPERSDQKIIRALGKQGTLKKIDEKWIWKYILSMYFK